MPELGFDILNVFAVPGEAFSGNPLAVVSGADGLPTATCQGIARQFNLSETTFLYAAGPPDPGGDRPATGPESPDARTPKPLRPVPLIPQARTPDALVRVFTPTIELPFAGHPTLGSAAVVAQALGATDVVLRMPAGDIPVTGADGLWTLTANPARVEESGCSTDELADMIGAEPSSVVGPGVWVDAGLRQLLVQVGTAQAVAAARPQPQQVLRHAMTASGEALLYVWAWSGPDTVLARLFFSQDTSIVEDPATGSAAANLGGLLAAQGARGRRVTISQGAAVSRPSRLLLEVTAQGGVRVGGLVTRIGGGTLQLP